MAPLQTHAAYSRCKRRVCEYSGLSARCNTEPHTGGPGGTMSLFKYNDYFMDGQGARMARQFSLAELFLGFFHVKSFQDENCWLRTSVFSFF
jgi:hypothetical protein